MITAPELIAVPMALALAKDWYEARTGMELLTGDPLSGFQRSMATIGVAAAIVVGPVASVAKGTAELSKAVGLTEELIVAGKNIDEVLEIKEVSKISGRVIDSAKNSTLDVSVINNLAGSSADAIRLKTQLRFMEDGILDTAGKITQQAATDSKILIRGSDLNNPAVIIELTKDGSKISDWGKYTTKAVTTSNGQKLQVHYYRNDVTGAINYNIDFKINQVVQP